MNGLNKYTSGFFLACILFCAGYPLKAHGQEISATANAPEKEYLVGDRINVTLKLSRPENFSVSWKRKEPEKNKLELADSITTDSVKKNGIIVTSIHLPLAGFDSGIVIYPAQVFVFRKKGDTSKFVIKTDSLAFHVSTVSVDMKKEIKPIVEPVSPGLDLLKVLEYVLLYLLIAGIILLGVLLWLRKRRQQKEAITRPPDIRQPAWEKALEHLALLQKENHPSKGDVKGYYIALTDILRRYISIMFRIDAMELTTGELLEKLKEQQLINSIEVSLDDVLSMADSVKFARYTPQADDHEKAMNEAVDIVYQIRDAYADRLQALNSGEDGITDEQPE